MRNNELFTPGTSAISSCVGYAWFLQNVYCVVPNVFISYLCFARHIFGSFWCLFLLGDVFSSVIAPCGRAGRKCHIGCACYRSLIPWFTVNFQSSEWEFYPRENPYCFFYFWTSILNNSANFKCEKGRNCFCSCSLFQTLQRKLDCRGRFVVLEWSFSLCGALYCFGLEPAKARRCVPNFFEAPKSVLRLNARTWCFLSGQCSKLSQGRLVCLRVIPRTRCPLFAPRSPRI